MQTSEVKVCDVHDVPNILVVILPNSNQNYSAPIYEFFLRLNRIWGINDKENERERVLLNSIQAWEYCFVSVGYIIMCSLLSLCMYEEWEECHK